MVLVEEFDASTDAANPTEVWFGTLCGGSEMYLSSLVFYAEAWGIELGLHVRFRQAFSCEEDLNKDEFSAVNNITGTDGCVHFACIHDLAANPLSARMTSGERRALPTKDGKLRFIVAGTSCKEASRLSQKHKRDGDGRDAVNTSSGSTGGTFKSFVVIQQYLKVRRILQENVLTVFDVSAKTGKSNYQCMEHCWNTATPPHAFVCCDMSASTGGIPCRRPRLYMDGRPMEGEEATLPDRAPPSLQNRKGP